MEATTKYEPLADVRKELKVKWIRPKIEATKLQELNKRNDAQGWFQALGHLGVWVLTGACVFYFWAHENWIAVLVALFFHGTVASFFVGTAPHELGHGTVFKTKSLNQLFLNIFSGLGWWDQFDFAASHTYHHRYTLHPEGDRENLLPISPMVGPFFLVQLLTINLLTQPGRTFGKGGLLSTIYHTVLGAFGRVGNTEIPHLEWVSAVREDQPDQYKNTICHLVGPGSVVVPWHCDSGFVFERLLGFRLHHFIFTVHRQLGLLCAWYDPALWIKRERQ
jgi:hypothetical protein